MKKAKYIRVKTSTSNQEYIHGDFDKDKVPNIDDAYPFDRNRTKRVNPEVSLSDTFKYIDVKRAEARNRLEYFLRKNPGYYGRVKDTYSTINKLVRENPVVSRDFIGVRKESDKRKGARADWTRFNKGFEKKNPITENKYKSNANTPKLYRAYHSNIVFQGFGLEAQFRTKRYGRLNDVMHDDYKKGKSLSKYRRRSRRLLRKGY